MYRAEFNNLPSEQLLKDLKNNILVKLDKAHCRETPVDFQNFDIDVFELPKTWNIKSDGFWEK